MAAYIIISILVHAALLLLSQIIEARTRIRRGLNRLTLVSLAWVIANSYSTISSQHQLYIIQTTMLLAVAQVASLFILLFYLTEEKAARIKKLVFIPGALIPVVAYSNALFSGLTVTGEGTNTASEAGIITFAATTLYYIALSIRQTFKARRLQFRKLRHQIYIIATGWCASFLMLFLLNFIAPTALNNPSFVSYGPLLLLPAILLTIIALVKYRFLGHKLSSKKSTKTKKDINIIKVSDLTAQRLINEHHIYKRYTIQLAHFDKLTKTEKALVEANEPKMYGPTQRTSGKSNVIHIWIDHMPELVLILRSKSGTDISTTERKEVESQSTLIRNIVRHTIHHEMTLERVRRNNRSSNEQE